MASVFTINFPFRGSSAVAVVTQINGITTIYLPDESFHGMLPQGRFSFSTQSGIDWDIPQLQAAKELLMAAYSVLRNRDQKNHFAEC